MHGTSDTCPDSEIPRARKLFAFSKKLSWKKNDRAPDAERLIESQEPKKPMEHAWRRFSSQTMDITRPSASRAMEEIAGNMREVDAVRSPQFDNSSMFAMAEEAEIVDPFRRDPPGVSPNAFYLTRQDTVSTWLFSWSWIIQHLGHLGISKAAKSLARGVCGLSEGRDTGYQDVI